MTSKVNLDENCIAYNDTLQGIQLELELFKRTNLTNKNIVVIEKNKTICIQLSSILKKIGFTKIKFCENVEQGLHVFKQIHANYEEAIIFQSFIPNDASISDVILNILDINAHTKIILLSTPKDKGLASMALMQGVFDILEFPLSMSNVTSIIEKIKLEYHDEEDRHVQSSIQSLLSTRKNIHVLELSELTGTDPKKIIDFLEFLQSNHKAKKIGNIKIVSCNNCESTLVGQIFSCPICESDTFTHKDLLEHYSCGNVSIAEEYVNEVCPKCKKTISALGVDYKKIQNYFVCNQCNEKFTDPKSTYLCKKCDNSFSFNESKLIGTENFAIVDS